MCFFYVSNFCGLLQNKGIFISLLGSRVRFTLPSNSLGESLGAPKPSSPGDFHRSASTPHSLYAMGCENSSQFFHVTSSRSDENIAEQHVESLPTLLPLPAKYEESSVDDSSQRESRLLTEAFQRARDHLQRIACRAQTHCSRDLLWHRLFAGETEEEEKDGAKKSRRKSTVRKSSSESSLRQSWMKSVDSLNPGIEQVEFLRFFCILALGH